MRRPRKHTELSTAIVAIGAALVLSACSSDSDSGSPAAAGGTSAAAGSRATAGSSATTAGNDGTAAGETGNADAGTGGTSSNADAGAGGTPTGGSPALTATFASKFDLSKSQLPEGLAIRAGIPYVGLAPTGEIDKVNLADGTLSAFATLPAPVPNMGFMTGLVFGTQDPTTLYAELVSFVPAVQPGIYRVAAAGGMATLFAKDPAMIFPNGMVTDDAGNWFVADSNAGSIFRISPDGLTVEKWATDDLLAGDKDKSCAAAKGAGLPFNIGANGIVKNGNTFYVTNTDKGLIVRIPVGADGKAGAVTLFAGPDCDGLGGADGLTMRGSNLIAADNFRNQLVSIGPTGAVTSLVLGTPLDFPASVSFDKDTLYVTNFAFLNAQSGKGSPGLISIDFSSIK